MGDPRSQIDSYRKEAEPGNPFPDMHRRSSSFDSRSREPEKLRVFAEGLPVESRQVETGRVRVDVVAPGPQKSVDIHLIRSLVPFARDRSC